MLDEAHAPASNAPPPMEAVELPVIYATPDEATPKNRLPDSMVDVAVEVVTASTKSFVVEAETSNARVFTEFTTENNWLFAVVVPTIKLPVETDVEASVENPVAVSATVFVRVEASILELETLVSTPLGESNEVAAVLRVEEMFPTIMYPVAVRFVEETFVRIPVALCK